MPRALQARPLARTALSDSAQQVSLDAFAKLKTLAGTPHANIMKPDGLVLLDEGDIPEKILHIDLGEWTDMLLIAPLTADTLSDMAHGKADKFLQAGWAKNGKKLLVNKQHR